MPRPKLEPPPPVPPCPPRDASPPLDLDSTAAAFAHLDDRGLARTRRLLSGLASPRAAAIPPRVARLALSFVPGAEAFVRRTVFRHFCGGVDLDEARVVMRRLAGSGLRTILDYAAEGAETEAAFDAAEARILEALRAAPPAELFGAAVKVTALARRDALAAAATMGPSARPYGELDRALARLFHVARVATRQRTSILIDAEESWHQETIDRMAACAMRTFNRKRAVVFTTVQMYRRDRPDALRAMIAAARAGGHVLGVKLVRGAYVEAERERAAALGHASPICASKEETDRQYDDAVRLCLSEIDHVEVCLATHNVRSVRLAVDEMRRRGLAPNDPRVSFAQLYGMSDPLSFGLAGAGFRVAKYLPYGPVRMVIPYLLRRAQENRAVADQTPRELAVVEAEMRRRGLL